VLHDLLFRLRTLTRRRAAENELDDELRFHLEQQVDKYVQSGMTEAEAMRRARLEFGGLDQVKDECREARGISFVGVDGARLALQRSHSASLARVYRLRCPDAGPRDRSQHGDL